MSELVRRVHFFTGQLLSPADFQAEQSYHREMRYLHNRLLGCGVAYGLEVTTDGTTVHVSPGVAIDPVGREIVLADEAHLDLPTATDEMDAVLDVAVTWAQEPDAFVVGSDETGELRFGRWVEQPRLSVGPPGSAPAESLVLARLERTDDGTTVDASIRTVLHAHASTRAD